MSLLDKILFRYQNKDYVTQKKARVIFLFAVSIFVLIPIILSYILYMYGLLAWEIEAVMLAMWLCVGLSIVLFAKGFFSFTAHFLIISCLGSVWVIMFVDNLSPLIKLDSIIYTVGFLIMTPLVTLRKKTVIIAYNLANMLLFVVFLFHIHATITIEPNELYDYIIDTSVTLVFTCIATYLIFTINQQALERSSLEIEERKKAEEHLVQLQNMLTSVIDSMPSMLIGVDNNSNVIQWNKETQLHSRVLKQQALGKNLFDVYPKCPATPKHLYEALNSKEPMRHRKIKFKHNKKNRLCDITIYPIVAVTSAGDIEGAVVRIDDITERVHLDEMIMQSEKMVSLGGLAAGMAHEINNPLAGIVQNLQVIKQRLKAGIPKNHTAALECNLSMEQIESYAKERDLPKLFENIENSCNRAAKIVSNMLSFGKKSEDVFNKEDIGKLLVDTVDLASADYDLKKTYDFKQIKINYKFNPNTKPVSCDSSKIQQVFFNLLKNAAQALSENNPVQPSPQIDIETETLAKFVQIKIKDNGKGISPKSIKRIFEPFYTTKDPDIGTGLGLSVSYFIITEVHNGKMSVESTLNKGTCFTVCLPVFQ